MLSPTLPSTPLSPEVSAVATINFAKEMKKLTVVETRSTSLLDQLKKTSKVLNQIHQELFDAEKQGQTTLLSVNWVLDNFYLIRSHINDVFHHLPKSYYRQLPKIQERDSLPKVYLLANQLIKNNDGKLTFENIREFLIQYQKIDYLKIGELWAFPLFLKLGLIDALKNLVLLASDRQKCGERANLAGNKLLEALHKDKESLPSVFNAIKKQFSNPSPHFSGELLDHLFDEDELLVLVKEWLETSFKLSIAEILSKDQVMEAAEQVSMANAITSLMFLTQLDFRLVFSQVCKIESLLNEDKADVFKLLSFKTSDLYLHAIELLSRGSHLTEQEVAIATLNLSHEGKDHLRQHVGYYLIDDGRLELEKRIGYIPTFFEKVQRFILKHPTSIYVGGMVAFTFLLTFLIFYYLQINPSYLMLFIPLAVIPISEVVLQIQNVFFNLIIKPFVLPKLEFKSGIPKKYKTLVVVPILLSSKDAIAEHLRNLEVRYLANVDLSLKFSLFSDFKDHSEETAEDDSELIQEAISGIDALNSKYGKGLFFLFHRVRVFTPSENAYIGKERKRGKLEALNRFLLGKEKENILYAGDKDELNEIRYVITLDADTELLKNEGAKLIETLAHPLNEAVFDPISKRVTRGYTLIQPRISTSLPSSNKTYFSKIFSGGIGSDPYTESVSDVYQDMFHEGSYLGKGIYDLKLFHEILDGYFPDSHLLSHDLIEGAFVRVGFASSIELLDEFPENYEMYTKREHRWIRGDWQILGWLNSRLSFINRFKIFDNLRRSTLPIFFFLLIITAAFLQTHFHFWLSFVLGIIFIPTFALLGFHLFQVNKEFILSSSAIKNNFLKNLLKFACLPYEAYLSLDAIVRVLYRKLISKKHFLQWTLNDKNSLNQSAFFTSFNVISFSGCLLLLASLFLNRESSSPYLLPLVGLWILSPLLMYLTGNEIEGPILQGISLQSQEMVRLIARKTWRYFDDFVTEETQFLPPDNFQESYEKGIAFRTSPTNIGLYLLSICSAYDFQFISQTEVFKRVKQTMTTLLKMEKYDGHLLNWYEIKTLEPLLPKYVSTVDSGNLLACLWTLNQAISDMFFDEIISVKAFTGIKDTILQLKSCQFDKELSSYVIYKNLSACSLNPIDSFSKKMEKLNEIISLSSLLVETLEKENLENGENVYWAKKIEMQSRSFFENGNRYLGFINPLQKLEAAGFEEAKTALQILESNPLSLYAIGFDKFECLEPFLNESYFLNQIDEVKKDLEELRHSFFECKRLAKEIVGEMSHTLVEVHHFANNMNMQFLYNALRKVFAIGYHVSDCRLDNSYYDLLATEARLASFVAIAKDDAPTEHWWALGRNFSVVNGQKVLLSWGGTMFEYLMPLLLTKSFRNSLLDEACKSAVLVQIIYGKKRGIPWGISESGFSEIDAKKTYQYQSFGVPRLGLKRGLEEDLVVSPYSTALALMVDSKNSIANLKRLMHEMHSDIFGKYGYYESIDYTRQHGPYGERGVVVHAYFAHHQGMAFIAMNNLLHGQIMQERFHGDPRVSAIQSLLYEKISSERPLTKDYTKYAPTARLKPVALTETHRIETEKTAYPKINLLSNGTYSVMLNNSGTGYSHFDQTEITRWGADFTANELGSFCYIKDLQTGNYWSSTYQPTLKKPDFYSVHFTSDKIEYKRRDFEIETITEIVVSPEDNAEIRHLNFINLSTVKRHLEITSYLELSLSPHLNDRSHPMFNKMFIKTERLSIPFGLIATRRLRSNEEKPLFAAHLLRTKDNNNQILQYETDRGKFIGRGRDLANPIALDNVLSNTTGDVLDPIFSLRKQLVLEPGQRVEVAFITLFATSDEKLRSLINTYNDFNASMRAIEVAWTYSHLQLRHLKIHQEDAQTFQQLAGKIIYPQKKFRTIPDRLKKNKLHQSDLWAFGISGDLPIIVVTVGDIQDLTFVKEMLVAHTFLNMRGLKCDLIFLNEEATAYEQPLKSQISRFIQAHLQHAEMEKGGQVFLLGLDQMSDDHMNLILSVAKIVLVAARGDLKGQLASDSAVFKQAPTIKRQTPMKDFISEELPFMELQFFNGLGGFSKMGAEYVIYLSEGKETPAPWINVISNPQFGVMVSESGIGTSWLHNSQTNRLTPWSNDPLLDPIADCIYIRDNDLGLFWSATPSPIRENDPYRVRHGQGYSVFEHNSHGINQELTVFVPVDENGGAPLRIQHLKLKNITDKKRVLSLMAYSELVLGENREDSGFFVVTEFDSETTSLFAVNSYNKDYGTNITFASCNLKLDSYTADRLEFIGRNRNLKTPIAMTKKNLLNSTGTSLDPCMALQVNIEINPGETKEVVFLLGQTFDKMEAKRLITLYQNLENVKQAFEISKDWWNDFLTTISVETKEPSIDYLLNRWLPYQNLSCRLFGRSAFYQSSGAYGFRDQLQDVMALLYSKKEIAREQILRSAAHQFLEGDVQHWWHPKSNGGIRTKMTDDLLWLPFVTAQYVRITGDTSILNEKISFLQGPLLEEHQHEIYFVPTITEEKATLLEHCRRALHKGLTKGIHGIPLIGSGDWNDGMNRVGIDGKGESVWLGFFLIHVLNDFVELLEETKAPVDEMEYYKKEAVKILEAIEAHAWDGNWYLRAYYDDGTPIGSSTSFETKIDSISQSWSVISSGKNISERRVIALESVKKHLVKENEQLVLLLTGAFDKTDKDPGYIKGYPPGIRENGGQYTHGSLWVPLAFARIHAAEDAVKMLQLINPINHSLDMPSVLKYRLEPYVVAADVYSNPSHMSQGGWNWYTGSAAWMYRIWIEEIFGLKIRGDKLSLNPVVPDDWTSFKLKYRYKKTVYEITYDFKEHGKEFNLFLDNEPVPSNEILLQDDEKEHHILVKRK